jgi:hypothetical protein
MFCRKYYHQGMDFTSPLICLKLQVGGERLMVIQIAKDPSQAHTPGFRGYSILPKDGVFCKVITRGEIIVSYRVDLLTIESR